MAFNARAAADRRRQPGERGARILMIDSHAHLISADTAAYPRRPASGTVNAADLSAPMTVERLLAEMDANLVDRAVLVQRGSVYGYDSSYVCDSAARFPERLAAVCSIDGSRTDSADLVRHWVCDRGAAGIRLMELVRGEGTRWLGSAEPREAWAAAAELDVPVCVHFFPWNRGEGLARLASILADIPGLTVVIDHFGAIRSDAGPPDHGVDALLEQVARFEGVNVKFTTIPLGKLDEAGIDAGPVVRRVMDLFGSERMMWGSDIAQSPGTYGYMTELARKAVRGLAASDQERILGGTARRIYGARWAGAVPRAILQD